MTPHPRPAPPRRERLERQEPLHRLGRRRPHRQGPGRGGARRPAARRGRRAARRRAHLGAAPGDHHRQPRARRGRPALDPGAARHWRLNERHYGALQGKDKKQTLERVRRGAVHALAPLLRHPAAADRRPTTSSPRPATRATPASVPTLPAHRVPQGRRRADAALLGERRSCPTCAAGKTVLVAAHGNSLRALVKHLDGISDDDIAGLNIPTGMPLVYRLDDDFDADRRPAASTSTPRPPRGRRGRGQPGPLAAGARSSATPRRRLCSSWSSSASVVRHSPVTR